jgi:electron transport complex protein RnfG
MAAREPELRARRAGRAAVALAVVSIAAFIAVTAVHEWTRDDIAAVAQRRALEPYVEVLDGLSFDNDLLADVVQVRDAELLGTEGEVPVHRARRTGNLVGFVIAPVAPDGYAGSIGLLVGVAADGRVLGVRITQHRETPGLGDAVDQRKSDWIFRFAGRSLRDPPVERWRTRKDGGEFDQLTGATVTSRAVVVAVANALLYVERHRAELAAPPATIPRS